MSAAHPNDDYAVEPAIDYEAVVIGAVLVDNARYAPCVSVGLRPEHFANLLYAELWRSIGELLAAGQAPSPLNLGLRFADHPSLRETNAPHYLTRLAVASAGIVRVADYARRVCQDAAGRRVVRLSHNLRLAMLDPSNDISLVLAEAKAELDQCLPTSVQDGAQPFSHGIDCALANIALTRERGGIDGVPYTLAPLDDLMGGIGKSDLVLLAGRPGMGKSALGLQVALDNARAGRRVLFFSLEMPQEQLATRALAELARVDMQHIRQGKIDDGEMQALQRAGQELHTLPLFVDDRSANDELGMRGEIDRIGVGGAIELMVVDYVQLMGGPPMDNRVQQVSAISAGLKAIARDYRIPVLALSQLNRAVEGRDDKRPQLADLRDSGALEQDADAVIFVYREEYYAKQTEPPDTQGEAYAKWRDRLQRCSGQADLIVAKNRHGPCATVAVGFAAAFTRFHALGEP